MKVAFEFKKNGVGESLSVCIVLGVAESYL